MSAKPYQLIHGDCLEVMKTIADGSIDLTVTSPPYFNAREYSHYQTVADYMRQMKAIFAEVYRLTKPSRMVAVNISPVLIEREKRSAQSYRIPLPFYFVPMMEEIGFEFLEDIIWQKPDGSAPNRNAGFFQHRKPVAYKPNIVTEYILVFKKPANFLIDKVLQNHSLVADGYDRTNIWRFNPETKSEHPAPFPEELPMKCIKYYSYQGETILDPFCGSGTTGKTAVRLNRRFIGIEKELNYFEIAQRRIEESLNKEPLFAVANQE